MVVNIYKHVESHDQDFAR